MDCSSYVFTSEGVLPQSSMLVFSVVNTFFDMPECTASIQAAFGVIQADCRNAFKVFYDWNFITCRFYPPHPLPNAPKKKKEKKIKERLGIAFLPLLASWQVMNTKHPHHY